VGNTSNTNSDVRKCFPTPGKKILKNVWCALAGVGRWRLMPVARRISNLFDIRHREMQANARWRLMCGCCRELEARLLLISKHSRVTWCQIFFRKNYHLVEDGLKLRQKMSSVAKLCTHHVVCCAQIPSAPSYLTFITFEECPPSDDCLRLIKGGNEQISKINQHENQ
jgi:hypothetical protein